MGKRIPVIESSRTPGIHPLGARDPAKGESKAIPQARIGLNDARALLAILKGYLAYVYGSVPSSRKRDAQIRVLQGVRGRLEALLAAPGRAEVTPIWLTRQEIRFGPSSTSSTESLKFRQGTHQKMWMYPNSDSCRFKSG